ncbi:MAG: cytochrome P450 [Bacteroidota bacterium]
MPAITKRDLEHIPGDWGLPVFGHFFDFVKDATNFYEKQRRKFGDVFKISTPLGISVVLCGPTANKFVLVEEGKYTSSKEAWQNSIGELFPNGLMLMDGDQHKYHRGIMQEAFKKGPMQGYLDIMPAILSNGIDELESKNKMLAFPFFKGLTLKVAARVFFGLDPKDDLTEVNKAITDIVNASAKLKIKLPFTKYQKGLNGRKFLIQFFKKLLPERRANPGKDLFSKLCVATDEEGNQFTDQEIIDHLIFVLMAAHDTTAITLTLMSYYLAKHQDWQDLLRREGSSFKVTKETRVNDLRQLEKMGLVMKEALRIHPPLITVSRKMERDIEVNDISIPKNAFVSVVFQVTHHDERIWSNPAAFDPERFNKQRNEQLRCPFGYAPFGAGKHHCIGYQFAELMVKLGMTELLKRYRLTIPEGYEMPVQDVPLKQPKDNLPLYLTAL